MDASTVGMVVLGAVTVAWMWWCEAGVGVVIVGVDGGGCRVTCYKLCNRSNTICLN